jgi:thiol-disulfide isomerase/thioredoxin
MKTDQATVAVQRYLAGNDLVHGPDARLLLAILQMQKNHNWKDAWQTIRTILQEDPIEPVQSQIDVAIDDEADEHPEKGRDWSEERYTLLLDRSRTKKPGPAPVPYNFVLSAGSDLVHRCYFAGDSAHATKVLDEMNSYVKSHPGEATGWGVEDLHWANLEMHAAPEVAVLKTLGGKADSNLIQTDRVEVISFFFLGCAPCLRELSELNALQRRYGEKRLQVTAVTTYEKNSYLTPFTHCNIEVSLEKARQKTSQRIGMVLTTEGTLQSYGVQGFPVVALVDKMGRLQ